VSVEAAIERASEQFGPVMARAFAEIAREVVREELGGVRREYMPIPEAAEVLGQTVGQIKHAIRVHRESLVEAGAIRQAAPGAKLEISPRMWERWRP